MLFRGQAVLTLHERHSRAPRRPAPRQSRCPHRPRLVITGRQTVSPAPSSPATTSCTIQTFFCDPHGQKGGIENAIGRLRRTLPRKTDLASLPAARFTQLVQAYNNTPRKCLGYQTPAEVFWDHLLHLECESTFRLSPE